MGTSDCRRVFDILDVLLYSFAILPGLRDKEDRDLLIFPVPSKGVCPTYDEISTVCNYLITVPKRNVLNRGIAVLVDTTDAHMKRLADIFIFLRQLQATVPGCIVVIHLISAHNNKKKALLHFKDVNPYLGIEVQCSTLEELLCIIPPTSLPTSIGGHVPYDNDVWVKFRCNVEPFLSDCKSMGKRLENLVQPLLDVESVLSETCDAKLVTKKYTDLATETMNNLHIQSLLKEGKILIERYTSAAVNYPDMQDTLSSISEALSQLGSLQDKVQHLAEKGQDKAKSMAAYNTFKRNSEHLSKEMRQLKSQISDLTDVGVYDVSTVQSKQAMLLKYQHSAQTLEVSVNRCVAQGMDLGDISRLKDAEKDIRTLQNDLKILKDKEQLKKEKLDEIFEFHRLVEECMSWFFSGIQRFTAQPVQRCNTLEGICELEVELDQHLSRCPIEGYGTLEDCGNKIATKAAISRIKMIKSKFNLFEKIVTERQEYLKRLKNTIQQKQKNTQDVDKSTLTGLTVGTKTCTTQSAEGSQFDPKDVFGSIRNSTAQTDMTCICSSDRIRHLSARISAVEMRLGIPDRSSNLPQSSGILERLAHILTRIGIIESYLKRLRFSSVYDSFYDHPKLSNRACSELLLDFGSLQGSDISNRSPLQHDPRLNRPAHSTGIVMTPSTITSSNLTSPSTMSPSFTSPRSCRDITISPRNLSVVRDNSPSTRSLPHRVRDISPSSSYQTGDNISVNRNLGSSSIPDSSPNESSRVLSSTVLSPESLQSDDPISGHSTPASSRLSSHYPVTIPRSPSPNDDQIVRDKLAEIETLLLDIEHQIHYDLKVHSTTQTGEESAAISDSSSQTESESETESVSTQHSARSVSSATQCAKTSFSGRGVQVTPNASSVATDTNIVLSSSCSQSDLTQIKNQHSQSPVNTQRHVSSQYHYASNTASTGVQHDNPGTDAGVQICPVHHEVGVQNSREFTQHGSQTERISSTSSESQVNSDSSDSFVQTDMIGLFPASVQTDVQHFAAGFSQTDCDNCEVGVTVIPDSADKSASADIKSDNHKEVAVSIQPKNHKSVSAIVHMTTSSTAAKITKLFHKSVNTTIKSINSEPQAAVQATSSVQQAAVDTSDLEGECKTTDTDSLVYSHDESSQTTLFETYHADAQSQTEEGYTLLVGKVPQSTIHKEIQTSGELSKGDTPELCETGKEKVVRPTAQMHFKDVSYLKNKTHQLRVAKIQKSREEAETKAAKDKKIVKRSSTSKSKEDIRKTKEDSKKSKEDLRKSKEDLRKSKEDLRKSKENLRKSKEDLRSHNSVDAIHDECTCSEGHVELSPLTALIAATDQIEEEYEDEEETDSEEGEVTKDGGEEQAYMNTWTKTSFIFPTEEAPAPIKESVGQEKYTVLVTLPKKLQFVIQEMLVTEEKYVEDLRHVAEGYMDPMLQNPDPNISGLAENIFQYFEQIYSFHSNTFMSSIVAAGTSETPLSDIATTFIRHEQELAVYLSFMVHERRAHGIIQQHHSGLIAELEQSLQDKLGLSANLLKPTQRMVKYKQFLDVILAASQELEKLEDVEDAQTMITNILNTSNDLCHLQALQLPLDMSHDSTGELIKQSDFQVSVNNKQKKIRRVFLFENFIVYSKEVAGAEEAELKYRSKHVIGLHEIGLTPYIPEEPTKCHIWTGEMSFTMHSCPEQAEDWSKSISTILWGQLKQIKRDRDMSRMKKTRGAIRSRGAVPKRK